MWTTKSDFRSVTGTAVCIKSWRWEAEAAEILQSYLAWKVTEPISWVEKSVVAQLWQALASWPEWARAIKLWVKIQHSNLRNSSFQWWWVFLWVEKIALFLTLKCWQFFLLEMATYSWLYPCSKVSQSFRISISVNSCRNLKSHVNSV